MPVAELFVYQRENKKLNSTLKYEQSDDAKN